MLGSVPYLFWPNCPSSIIDYRLLGSCKGSDISPWITIKITQRYYEALLQFLLWRESLFLSRVKNAWKLLAVKAAYVLDNYLSDSSGKSRIRCAGVSDYTFGKCMRACVRSCVWCTSDHLRITKPTMNLFPSVRMENSHRAGIVSPR